MAGGAREIDTNADNRMPKATEQTHSNPAPQNPARTTRGFALERFNTRPGVDPMSELEWDLRTAVITGEDGRVVFEQKDVEVPRAWSQTATNVVVSKYFRGPLKEDPREVGVPKRETSVRQLVLRVVDTIAGWGEKQAYFATSDVRETFRAELLHLLLTQKASFNSPVYFNVGIDAKPQCSACFILKVDDSMESILGWYRNEGMIFKGGSGSGVNLSALRSQREKLSSGGTASGPLSFMKAADASAGVIQSGGKTRRAAKDGRSSMPTIPTSRNSSVAKLRKRRRRGRSSMRVMTARSTARLTARCFSRTRTTRCASATSTCARSRTTPTGRLAMSNRAKCARSFPPAS